MKYLTDDQRAQLERALSQPEEEREIDLNALAQSLRQLQEENMRLRSLVEHFRRADPQEDAPQRNRRVQAAWSQAAMDMPDLDALLGEIAAYIEKRPELALTEDGLERAYQAVRSAKYRPEQAMLADPDTLSRLAQDDRLRETVIRDYILRLLREGENLPLGIQSGGGTPLTGRKQPPRRMSEAKERLSSLLGVQEN